MRKKTNLPDLFDFKEQSEHIDYSLIKNELKGCVILDFLSYEKEVGYFLILDFYYKENYHRLRADYYLPFLHIAFINKDYDKMQEMLTMILDRNKDKIALIK